MTTALEDRVKRIRDFGSLVEYLRADLDWPIESDDIEDIAFEWEPEELGLKPEVAVGITKVKQLRPLIGRQPWGIFYIEFETKRLPVVLMRRILKSLTFRKKATADAADRPAWDSNDLLFVCSTGEATHRGVTFAHFEDTGEGQARLKTFSWDEAETHFHYLRAFNLEALRWPDDTSDWNAWREGWSGAFVSEIRQTVRDARELSLRLASLAKRTREVVQRLLDLEAVDGPLNRLFASFKAILIHELNSRDFADMLAQTIAYGLFSARVTGETALGISQLEAMIPGTNPFLRELFAQLSQLGGPGTAQIDFDELGVGEIVDLLNDMDVEAILRDFGRTSSSGDEDPVIHFYESFLREYDPEQRMQRGVFYTPRPVVSFIVRSIDEILQSEFGIEDGLASVATWAEASSRGGGVFKPPVGRDGDPFVQILDPAVGTGTFLVEIIDLVHSRLTHRWRSEGLGELEIEDRWNGYVPEHLLPRLHGYELLMAPYAIAHLKIGVKLRATGYRFENDERLRVFLTNTLEPGTVETPELPGIGQALAHEAESANHFKMRNAFTIVLGNPPYANYSANLSESARSLVDKYRNFCGSPIRERNQLQFERNLQDDFVKFVAIAESSIVNAGVGVMGFITNAALLASGSLRGVREHLVSSFSTLYELDLHGGLNESLAGIGKDENVFDISQAVAIHVYVKRERGSAGSVHYASMIGLRAEKFGALSRLTAGGLDAVPISLDSETCSFTPQDAVGEVDARRLDEVFTQYGAGIKTNRDAVAIGFTRKELLEQVSQFLERSPEGLPSEPVVEVLYRPYDVRYVYYDQDLVASRSLPTMRHMLSGPNVGLLASSTWTTPERFSVNVSTRIAEMKTGTHDRGTTLFPLYVFDQILGSTPARRHNLSSAFVEEWKQATETEFVEEGSGDLRTTSGPEDVLNWIYALCYSSTYRDTFRAALARGFPIVLLPDGAGVLRQLVAIGKRLVRFHLMDTPASDIAVAVVGRPPFVVEKVSYSAETVWIDRAQSKGFARVPADIWGFYLGGYRVCEKWLKDRQARGGRTPRPGRKLGPDDLEHYRMILSTIGNTLTLQEEIETAIESHGGWRGAFAS